MVGMLEFIIHVDFILFFFIEYRYQFRYTNSSSIGVDFTVI